MAVQKEIDYEIHYGDLEVTNGISVFSEQFDEHFAYDGDDLGLSYTPERTSFKLWAPTSSEAYVMLYDRWDADSGRAVLMQRGERGTWICNVEGDLRGAYYTYKVRVGTDWNEAVDPYARVVGVNGDKAAIIPMELTNPDRWTTDKPTLKSHLDAIIYELHIRDASIHASSGIQNKGKFLGLCEAGTTGPGGVSTGLDHIAKLGITHVQLLPVYDYSTDSVDETKLDTPQYNWGYDPKNYNVPEGSYATDPYEPISRIKELKQLVQTFHDRGLRVIMDVVYNHVFDAYRVNFTKLVPGYYLRYYQDGKLSNGSGCGNDTASERKMMRKFIVDSVLYWAKEYHIDGFRFDLMGLHDVDTMNEIREKLDEIDPTIITIGEGWFLNTALPEELRATQMNCAKMPRIGHFNDYYRNAVKGNIFYPDEKGFVSGQAGMEIEMKRGIAGSIQYDETVKGFAVEPIHTVNYVECHDNHSLWDKIELSNASDAEEIRVRMHVLSTALMLTSQGIAFLHAGQEFLRTKNGVENSYKSPDEVNWLDWERCAQYRDEVERVKQLIAIRKQHAAFRMPDADSIRKQLHFEDAPAGCVVYSLRDHANGDEAKHLLVVHNANAYEAAIQLPELGEWELLYNGQLNEAGAKVYGGEITVPAIGTVILAVK